MLWPCIVCQGDVLYVRVVYCLLWRSTVFYGGVLRVMVVYCMLFWCIVW